MKAWYKKLAPDKKARLWTLILSGMTFIASSADKVVSIPGFPPYLANAWPVLVSLDVIILKIIPIFTDVAPVPPTDTKP